MNRHSSFNREPLSPVGSQNAGGLIAPAVSSPATYSRCPDCDGSFSDRITDEDTGMSYPADDGEHYCRECDAIWTDNALAVSSFEVPEGWSRVEL